MKIDNQNVYICPACAAKFTLTVGEKQDGAVITGEFTCVNGHSFPIAEGIPDFTWPKELAVMDEKTRLTYEKMANEYEKFADFPFMNFFTDQAELREKMTDQLNLKENSVVLEIGAGDGRGAQHVAKRLGKNARYYIQELSRSFLKKSFERLEEYKDIMDFSIANASYLSFPDNHFDAAYHFGGFSTFSEVGRCLKEMARVVKPGGKVLVGDESMGPWLRKTEFGKIMANSNPCYNFEIPFAEIPVEARNVKVEWIMLGGFFLLEFTVGEGAPVGNYNVPIPSERGGSHWRRYYGNLEGVSDEAKQLAHKAREHANMSMSDWLDEVVRAAARKELGDDHLIA